MRFPSDLPFSPACERNKKPIGQVLQNWLGQDARVLEIGAGTGQHAVYFSSLVPQVHWQSTDVAENVDTLRVRFRREASGRLPQPLALDVRDQQWPGGPYDAVFTANTLHIMPFDYAPCLFEGAARVLADQGLLLSYGPFMDNGMHTSESNRQFDQSLRQRDPAMGIRDTAKIRPMAEAAGLNLNDDIAMPANNRVLVFRKG
jgi:cyclopropane fatty-acyl-phospholipid synthase-like methyltransferase